ncbi:MAG TPA: hypothetical protein VIQ53_11455, partial [Inquilinus sp.]
DQGNPADRIAEIVDGTNGNADDATHRAARDTEESLLSGLLAFGHAGGQATHQPTEQAIAVAIQNLLDNTKDAPEKAIK